MNSKARILTALNGEQPDVIPTFEWFIDRICLKGNIDCKGALQYGTPLEVAAEVRTCIEKGGAGGGLILSSSNTIHRGVKPENYRAMLAALKQFGRSTH